MGKSGSMVTNAATYLQAVTNLTQAIAAGWKQTKRCGRELLALAYQEQEQQLGMIKACATFRQLPKVAAVGYLDSEKQDLRLSARPPTSDSLADFAAVTDRAAGRIPRIIFAPRWIPRERRSCARSELHDSLTQTSVCDEVAGRHHTAQGLFVLISLNISRKGKDQERVVAQHDVDREASQSTTATRTSS